MVLGRFFEGNRTIIFNKNNYAEILDYNGLIKLVGINCQSNSGLSKVVTRIIKYANLVGASSIYYADFISENDMQYLKAFGFKHIDSVGSNARLQLTIK